MIEHLWVEKYRPTRLKDCIIPDEKMAVFQQFVDSGHIPNILLTSRSPGTGKTTVARALMTELGAEYIILNSSLHGNIDTLRVEISQYASAASFDDRKKYVIFDEADALTPATQLALRGFIEQYSSNCGFILTANYEGKIIEPIRSSRMIIHNFEWAKKDKPAMMKKMMKALSTILTGEGISYTKEILAHIVTKNFPDMRKMIGLLQNNVVNGELATTALVKDIDIKLGELVEFLKAKDFKGMRKWVNTNPDIDMMDIIGHFANIEVEGIVEPNSIPEMVLIMADYQYKHVFAPDRQLNITAMLTEMMARLQFE